MEALHAGLSSVASPAQREGEARGWVVRYPHSLDLPRMLTAQVSERSRGVGSGALAQGGSPDSAALHPGYACSQAVVTPPSCAARVRPCTSRTPRRPLLRYWGGRAAARNRPLQQAISPARSAASPSSS